MCSIFEHSLALPLFGIGMKTDLFQSCGNCRAFQICWHIECSTFTASSFRIWYSSTGIPSPPPALFIIMLCWRRLLRVPWTARRSNQSILKEISPGISLEGMMLKLKLQYFGHLCVELTHWKDSDAGRDWVQEEKGTTEDEMAGWHH